MTEEPKASSALSSIDTRLREMRADVLGAHRLTGSEIDQLADELIALVAATITAQEQEDADS